MKKTFRYYIIAWAILFAAFNLVAFVTPNGVMGLLSNGGEFWIGYVFISLALIGQLACTYFAFHKSDSSEKLFLNLPLITISYSAVIISAIVGAICIAVPAIPNWVGIILCVLILGFNAISIAKAQAAAEIVSDVGEKVKVKTQFIKEMTVDAQSLIQRAKSEETKAECKKVYEALRYSDPMSSDRLYSIEEQIHEEFLAFSDAVLENSYEDVKEIATGLTCLIDDRNKKCKLYK